MCNCLIGYGFVACLCVPGLSCRDVTNSVTENWETSHLDGKYLSQVRYVYDRPVCFQAWLGRNDGPSGGAVLVLNQGRTESFQDKTVT